MLFRRPAKGYDREGAKNGNAKLTEADVRAIRSDPRKLREIAAEYGLNNSYVSSIKKRRTWAHLEDLAAES
jgi:hypothetical protein